jgi:hypothetical protein
MCNKLWLCHYFLIYLSFLLTCDLLNSVFFPEIEIGLGLTGFGIFFSFLGIIFFFDKGLIAMGNVGFQYSIFFL